MEGNTSQQKTWGQSFPLCGGSYTVGCDWKGSKPAATAHRPAGSCNSLSLISELSRHLATMANMTFEDVDVEAVAELSAEEVEEREVFEQEEKEEVEGVLDFFLGGGQSRVWQQQVFGKFNGLKLLRAVVKERPGSDLETSTSLSLFLLMDACMGRLPSLFMMMS